MPGSSCELTSAVVPNQRRGILFAFAGILLLAFNVFDAADRGASGANIVAIACGAFLLFYGFIVVARSGRPPSNQPPSS
jgi:hypothetical protein